jgi:hypothetical protein
LDIWILFVFGPFFLGLFLILFLSIYFLPAMYQFFRPWICEIDLGKYEYSSFIRWYSNWMYRVCYYRCNLPSKEFGRIWLSFSAVYTFILLLFIFGIVIVAMDSPLCALGLFVVLFAVDVLLRKWIEEILRISYLQGNELNAIS